MTSPKLFVYKMLMVFHCNFTYLCRCVCYLSIRYCQEFQHFEGKQLREEINRTKK